MRAVGCDCCEVPHPFGVGGMAGNFGAASWMDEDRFRVWLFRRLLAPCALAAGLWPYPVLPGEYRSQQCFPHGIVVGAMQTASTGTRTSRVVPGHSCGTTRCEGTCYRGAGITIYLRKHEGGQQRHNCACCSKSALMLFYLVGTGN
ncbi:hypothetical protein TcCL_Unassigned00435 [Trypanosoma cruzi]|nr:hypothetical protein TcCL_Unassigned00435 [Trypanosoma cruzi]